MDKIHEDHGLRHVSWYLFLPFSDLQIPSSTLKNERNDSHRRLYNCRVQGRKRSHGYNLNLRAN